MPMSDEYRELRRLIGARRIFTPAVAAVILNDEGGVLFVREPGSPVWSLPAGAIELGETPSEAVMREVYEETGLDVRPIAVAGVFGGRDFRWEYPDHNQVEYLTVVFWCAATRGSLSPVDGEIAEFRYFLPEALPDLQFPYPPELFTPRPAMPALFQPPLGQESD